MGNTDHVDKSCGAEGPQRNMLKESNQWEPKCGFRRLVSPCAGALVDDRGKVKQMCLCETDRPLKTLQGEKFAPHTTTKSPLISVNGDRILSDTKEMSCFRVYL